MEEIERVAWKHTLPYVKYMGSGNLLCDTGGQPSALRQPRVWDAVGDGRGVQEGGDKVCLGLIHVDVWQKPSEQ